MQQQEGIRGGGDWEKIKELLLWAGTYSYGNWKSRKKGLAWVRRH